MSTETKNAAEKAMEVFVEFSNDEFTKAQKQGFPPAQKGLVYTDEPAEVLGRDVTAVNEDYPLLSENEVLNVKVGSLILPIDLKFFPPQEGVDKDGKKATGIPQNIIVTKKAGDYNWFVSY